MKYKLFISDYDRTLGGAPDNNIDAETMEAIERFIEKGGIFTVCSGRETSSITKILRKHNLTGPVVSFQGARITDIQSGESIFDGGLSLENALKALDAVAESGLTPIAYGKSELFVEEKNPYVLYYENAVGLCGEVVDIKEHLKNSKECIFKICWLGDDEVVNRTAERLNAKFEGLGIQFNSGSKNLLEAINPECGKGSAVRFLSKLYNIPFDKIITVGDSTNDIDLVKGEWHGVAVGDGREELKAVAKEITVPFKEKPIKTLLEKYCL